MEELALASANMEIALWSVFGTGRTANATALLALILAIWVAARFSSVSLEKNVNLVGKIFLTAFAVGVFMMGLVVFGNIGGTFEGHAGALAALDVGNGDIDLGAGSQAFIEFMNSGGNLVGRIGGMLVLVAGLAIAVVPLWVKSSD